MENSRLRKAYWNALTSLINKIVALVCSFLIQRLVIGCYGSSYNGIVSSAMRFLGFFDLTIVGLAGATRVALYKTMGLGDIDGTSGIVRANRNYYHKVGLWLIAYIVLLAVVLPNIIITDVERIHVSILVMIIGITSFVSMYSGILNRIIICADQHNYVVNIIDSCVKILDVIILSLMVYFGGNFLVAKGSSSLVYIIGPIAFAYYVKKNYHLNPDAPPNRAGLDGRWDVMANSFANIVHSIVGIFFVTFFCPTTEISVYGLYMLVAGGLLSFVQVITDGIEAAFGNMWVRHEYDALRRNTARFEYVMFSMGIVAFGCMFVLLCPFMEVYMHGVTDANYVRPWLALAVMLSEVSMCIRQPYVLLVQAVGHYRQTKKGSFVEAGLNIVLTYFFVSRYGIIGAAMGSFCANIFRSIQYGFYASDYILKRSCFVMLRRILWLAVTLLLAILLSRFVIPYTFGGTWLTWIYSAMMCVVIHVFTLSVSSFIFYREQLMDVIRTGRRAVRL